MKIKVNEKFMDFNFEPLTLAGLSPTECGIVRIGPIWTADQESYDSLVMLSSIFQDFQRLEDGDLWDLENTYNSLPAQYGYTQY